jgi:hypothetical protein
VILRSFSESRRAFFSGPAHDPFLELVLPDHLLAAASREESSLVDEVREICARESRGSGGERVEVDLAGDRLAARVNLEDLSAPETVGPVDDDLTIEAPGPEQRGVKDVGAVRGGDEDDVVLHLEAVHLDQELVQGLLTLVVTASEARAAMAADCVDLVHEDDAGRGLLRLLEEVAHT